MSLWRKQHDVCVCACVRVRVFSPASRPLTIAWSWCSTRRSPRSWVLEARAVSGLFISRKCVSIHMNEVPWLCVHACVLSLRPIKAIRSRGSRERAHGQESERTHG